MNLLEAVAANLKAERDERASMIPEIIDSPPVKVIQVVAYCGFCVGMTDEPIEAEYLLPQSIDVAETVGWFPACASHAEGWFDGGDWVSPLVYKLVKSALPE